MEIEENRGDSPSARDFGEPLRSRAESPYEGNNFQGSWAGEDWTCPPSLLRLSFLWESKLVARESRLWRDYAQKASAQLFRIADCGFPIFLVSFFNPHSAFYNPQFGGGPAGDPPDRPYPDSTRGCGSSAVPARPKKWNAPYDFCA